MKKIALIGLVSLCSVGAYAQGTVEFYPVNTSFDVDAEVYAPQVLTPTVEIQGDTAAQNIAIANGTTGVTYTGVPIGGASYGGTTPVTFSAAGSQVYTYGNLFTAELFAISTTTTTTIPGDATPLPITGAYTGSLQPVIQYQSTFDPSSAGLGAGYFQIANPGADDPGIPGTGFLGTPGKFRTGLNYLGNNAAAEVVAWFNGGGQFPDWASAQAAGVPWGQSSVFEITSLTEPASVMTQDNNNQPTLPQTGPTYLVDSADGSSYLQSFSLVTTIPEPSTIALGVIGACAFLARRRKK